jgi:hypothetical protein
MLLMRQDKLLRGYDDIALNRLFWCRKWRLSLCGSGKTRVASISAVSLGLLMARRLNQPI